MTSLIEFNLSTQTYGKCMLFEKVCAISEPHSGFMWVGIKGDWREFTNKEIIYYCLESLHNYIEQLIGEYTV